MNVAVCDGGGEGVGRALLPCNVLGNIPVTVLHCHQIQSLALHEHLHAVFHCRVAISTAAAMP